MTLGAGNIIQTSSGNTGALPTSIGVTLPGVTTGNTVLIGLTTDTDVVTPPTGFVLDAFIAEPWVSGPYSGNFNHYVWRKQASTGEDTFTFAFGSSIVAAWWVDEVSGLDTSAPLVTGIADGSATGVSSISTGTTATVTPSDILCIASYAAFIGANTALTFSGETNSFTEAHDENGIWAAGPESIAVAVARRYPGAGGAFQSTATISTTADQASGVLVVYQAIAAPDSVIDDVTIGGTFPLTAEVTLRDGSGTHLDLFTDSATVQGSIVLAPGLGVTGTMNYGTDEISVTATSVTFTVGDVVSSDVTGECMVVRDSWTTTEGPAWSNTVTRSTVYITTGWTVIGSASLN